MVAMVPFLSDDVDAVEQGKRHAYAAGDYDTAAALSWLATRMRNQRMAEIELEANELILERRIAEYGDQTVRVQHLRSVGGGNG